jgi:hypothetical protein
MGLVLGRRAEKLTITASELRGAVPIALAIQAASSAGAWGREKPPLAVVTLARRLGLASAG